MTCKVTVVTPKPTSVPAAGVWLICNGADPLQSVATRPLVVKSGTGAWQTPSAKALWVQAQTRINCRDQIISDDVFGLDKSMVSASMTCKVTVVTPTTTSGS